MAGFFTWGDNGEQVTPDEIDQRRQLAQSLMQQSQQPANYWTQGVANMVNSFLGGFERGRANKEQRQNEDYNKSLTQSLVGGGQGAQQQPIAQTQSPAPASDPLTAALTNPQTGVSSPASQNAASGLIADDYLNHLAQAESGGKLDAKAIASSALGPYQFTDGTWRGMMQQHPDLGLTADGRTDPAQAKAAAQAFTADNIAYMLAHGVQNPTAGQEYLAHFAGAPTASKLIQADPATPVSALMSSGQINANPFLRGMTAGDVQNWANNRIGISGVPSQQAAQPSVQQLVQTQGVPAVAMPQQNGPDMSQLLAAMSDPRANQQTRGIASALLQNRMQQDDQARQIQLKQADPLYQAQLQEYGARTAVLQQRMKAAPSPGYSMISPQQAQGMGLDPTKAYQVGPDGKINQIGASGVNVTLNNGPTTSEFQKKSDDAAAERLGGYIQDGNAAPALMGQLQQLSDLSKSIGTGGGTDLRARLGTYGQALGLNLDPKLSDKQAFSAIVNRMAPQMRPVGSGSSSDTDVRMFLNSLPSLTNTDRGNQIITGTLQALQRNKMQAADIASQAQRGQISWQDAESQIRKLPNPYEQFRKAHADLASGSVSNAPPAQQAATSTATQPQYRAGQRARLADGSIVTFNGTSWVRGN